MKVEILWRVLGSAFLRLCSPPTSVAPYTPPQTNRRRTVGLSLFLCTSGGIFWLGQSKEGDLLLRVTFLDFLRLIIPYWAQLCHRGGWNKVQWWQLAGSLLILVNLLPFFILFCSYSLCLFLWPFYSHFRVSLCSYFNKAFFLSPTSFYF